VTEKKVPQERLDLSDLSFETCMACRRRDAAPADLINDEITEWFYESGWWFVRGGGKDQREGWLCHECMPEVRR
jgi:hypothetical protein